MTLWEKMYDMCMINIKWMHPMILHYVSVTWNHRRVSYQGINYVLALSIDRLFADDYNFRHERLVIVNIVTYWQCIYKVLVVCSSVTQAAGGSSTLISENYTISCRGKYISHLGSTLRTRHTIESGSQQTRILWYFVMAYW